MQLLSTLDTERFGFLVGKDFGLTAARLPQVLEASRSQGLRLLLARCDADDWNTVHALQREGFLLMDTLVHLERPLADIPPGVRIEGIRDARPEDTDAIEKIARDAFTSYGGHYNVDSRLDARRVAEIYPSWARRANIDRAVAETMLVAESHGTVAGFAAMKALGAGLVDGILYAVAPAYQRQGWYRKLLSASLGRARESGFSAMRYSTQITNVAAQRAVAQLGFAPSRYFYTFHRWFDE